MELTSNIVESRRSSLTETEKIMRVLYEVLLINKMGILHEKKETLKAYNALGHATDQTFRPKIDPASQMPVPAPKTANPTNRFVQLSSSVILLAPMTA